ncbi:chorismate pyruvate-lyase family protein [Microbispora sp. NBRC 16548]|uniref:chorismate--pyruvate lyase family protein n=1 Tax=Microbispora sp. NBRC 16548 TaxID=3030994 RepID=UPI002552E3F4|nr:chorismate pyruvate-lyase family protein [Microbispora sp. NBRC 16548]
MVLQHDGSTTRILTCLLGEPLKVRVLRQHDEAASALAPHVSAHLKLSSEDHAIVRRSQLVRATGEAVSLNTVIMVPSRHPIVAAISEADDVPLGHILAQHVPGHHRRILNHGTVWHDAWSDLDRHCAYREYLICLESEPILYIQEVFSPEIVPAAPRSDAALQVHSDLLLMPTSPERVGASAPPPSW